MLVSYMCSMDYGGGSGEVYIPVGGLWLLLNLHINT
jgi:hypothetical protein